MSVNVCCVCGTFGGQKRATDMPKLEVEAVVSHLMWVLEIKLMAL